MNEQHRGELERLKERQAQLHHAVDLLGIHIAALEKRIAAGEKLADIVSTTVAKADASVPIAVPPLLAEVESIKAEIAIVQQPTANIEQPIVAAAELATSNLQTATQSPAVTPPPLPPQAFIPPLTPPRPVETKKPESFEMRLGTYWLVRIGIVAMLTALVFFGTYAYQNFIVHMGAAGKVAMLYVASGALLGFGVWFQRKAAKESLRDFAQVLLAGGMAAVYFTTYAAHHFANLRVIESEVLDGALLLGWAAVMAWTADRKKSEVFALFAVGLAYYSSVMTRVGHFTLYSNLVLTAAALFFLVRNRWAKLSFASLVATYASYGFWRFFSGEGWHWAGVNDGLWTGVYFLAAYWAVFTAAVFLSRHKEFAGVNRASFLTLNNAAFYVMFLLTMFQVRSGGFWKFNLITGAVLLGLAALAKFRLRDEPLAANTYLTQGLLLVTVGIIAKFSGMQLALLLALESVVLWMTGTFRQNIVMRTGACLSAAMATLWAFDGIDRNDLSGAWLGAGVGGLLAFNAFWAHWREQRHTPKLMRSTPTYFSVLALLVWGFALWQNVLEVHNPAAYALATLVLVASVHLTRLRELSLLGQLFLPFAAMQFIANQTMPERHEPWWIFATLVGAALALVHWWQKQSVIESPRNLRVAGQFIPALIMVGVTTQWLEPQLDAMQWVLAMSALAVAVTGYGAATRNWLLALVAQVFTAIAAFCFVWHAGTEALPWLYALAPLAALTLLALGGWTWAKSRPEIPAARGIAQAALWYGRVTMALVVWGLFRYVPEPELAWSYTAVGVAAFAITGWRQSRDFLVFTAVLNVCALVCLASALLNGKAVYAPNFLAVLAWMIEQQWARRQSERFAVPSAGHNATLAGAGVALWLLFSQWISQRGFNGCFYLTASWSVFAFGLIGAGVLLRERMYRWVGLGVLGAAVARVVVIDVWKLETLYRIVSFFALGLVLLTLGFIYNKYQERLRHWL
ncbi:MAG: hypothetical protein RLY20_3442 [Verrucomicrobiota bacterium]|jgi:uncharacterized membrane protein